MATPSKQSSTARAAKPAQQQRRPLTPLELESGFGYSSNLQVIIPMKQGQTLGLTKHSNSEIIQLIQSGLPYSCLETLRQYSGLSMEQLARLLQIAPRTLARRKTQGQLRPDESERLLRLGRVLEQALNMVGGYPHDAMQWLSTPAPSLGGQLPLEYAMTEIGAEQVIRTINRLEQGGFM